MPTPDRYVDIANFEHIINALKTQRAVFLSFPTKAAAQRIRYRFYVGRSKAARAGDTLWARGITVRVKEGVGTEWLVEFSNCDTELAEALERAGFKLDDPSAPRPNTAGQTTPPEAEPIAFPAIEPVGSSLIDAIRRVTGPEDEDPPKEGPTP